MRFLKVEEGAIDYKRRANYFPRTFLSGGRRRIKKKKTKNKQKILLSDQLQTNENPIAIAERSKVDTPNTKIHDRLFSVCAGTSIKKKVAGLS